MTKKLHIELTGPAPELGGGDTEGVSLRFFAAFALRLRTAYQRAAQGVITGKIYDEGRLPDRAKDVDIRLVTAKEGSLELDLAAVDARAQPGLPHIPQDRLADDALDTLMNVLELGQTRAGDMPLPFRMLVTGMPATIRQRYVLRDGSNNTLREVTLTSGGLADVAEEPMLAGIRRAPAKVRGLTFSPKTSVTLEVGGATVKAAASMEVVRSAMEQHDRTDLVATLVSTSEVTRLIRIEPAAEPFPRRVPSVDETLDRFAEVMEILAR